MKENQSAPPVVSAEAVPEFLPGSFRDVWAASVCILTFLAYAATLRFQFVYDDRGIILKNPAVHSWRAVPSYFFSQVWAAVAPADLGYAYRPLFLLWYRINAAVFGDHPAGWHFATVMAHVVATYCVFLLAHRLLGDWAAALFAGLVFGLHPVHIEAVAWISGGPDPLMTALLIPAYLCWVRSREAGGRGDAWLAASLTLYAAATLIKEPAVVLPLILFASQWLGFPRPLEPPPDGHAQKTLKILKALLPYLVLTAVYLVVRTVALKGIVHSNAQIAWKTILLTLPSLLFLYLKHLVWPSSLSPYYGLGYVLHPTLRNTILPTLVLLFVAGGLWKWACRARPVALALPWLIFPLLPVLNVQVFGNGNFAHDRYLYLPSAGFALLVAAALKHVRVGRQLPGGVRLFQMGVCVVLCLLMGFAIQVEDRCYASDAAFYSFAYSRMQPPFPLVSMNYANSLAEQGDYQHAAEIYRKLIQEHPDLWGLYFNFGFMCYQTGELNSASLYLSRAAAADPRNAGAFFYLGLTDLKLDRAPEAEANLGQAIALSPAAPNYHFALGMVLKVRGNLPAALAEFTKELQLNPGQAEAARQVAEIHRQLPGK